MVSERDLATKNYNPHDPYSIKDKGLERAGYLFLRDISDFENTYSVLKAKLGKFLSYVRYTVTRKFIEISLPLDDTSSDFRYNSISRSN